MIVASSDGGGGASVAEVDGYSWLAVEVGSISVAELPCSVVSPTADAAVVEECAHMNTTGGDGGGGESVG